MICRLCLRDINESNAVFLFETNEALAETALVKMIAKFLQLEIMPDDTISTSVCSECCEHLEDFHSFWQLVEQKQSTLKKEFLNVDCVAMKWTGGVDIDELPLVADTEVDEKPLDMNNLGLLSSVLDVNVDSVMMIPAPSQQESNDQELDTGSKPLDSGSDDESSCQDAEEFAAADHMEMDMIASATSDDELPLVKLQHKLKPARKKRLRRVTKKRQLTQELSDSLDGEDEDKSSKSKANEPTQEQANELEAALERKPKGCSRAQLTKRYEEVIANYMAANCDLCDFSTKYFSDLKTHFSDVHERDAYLKCCNRVFSRASKLMDHIRKHVNPKLFTCSICNKSLNSQDYLQTHIETVHNKTAHSEKVLKHPCSKCDRTFSSERRLTNHLLKHETDQLEHSCQICLKSFANVHRLRRHIQSIHEDLHPHVCDICGKKFKFKPSFERHLLEHQGVVSPAMQCKVCGVWLKNEHSLRLHRFTHDSTDTNCPHCGKTCSSRTALRAHVKYAHKLQTNLQCTYCDKTFKQQRNLEEHMAIHTGLQLYNCPHCPKECRSRSNMYVHIKQRHADEWLKAKMARSHNPQFKPLS
ncbi:transcription factor grauzone [Scaptodrosophila lebanonensis]|uniref:Transcription factor grauzone n=1 Tax=Drosophila lebanonensis TaxID=7225 RepID=A0A6J2U2Y3_DROLE|nr:transcription factor grauzone [Scaptodrosophila lebanonensis]